MKKFVAIIACAVLPSCAKSPDQIKAQYVSPMIYQHFTCEQLIAEHNRLTRHLSDAHAAQTKSANNDKAATAVGLVLFWPSLLFLGDDARASEYARIKGDFNALDEALIRNNCNVSTLEKLKLK